MKKVSIQGHVPLGVLRECKGKSSMKTRIFV